MIYTKYDLLTIIKYFIGSFTCCYVGFLIGKILLKRKFKEIKWYSYLVLALFSIISILVALVFDSIFKTVIILILIVIIYRIIFKTSFIDSVIYAIVTYILFILGELTVTLIMSFLLLISGHDIMNIIIKTVLGNFLVAIFSFIYTFCTRKFIVNTINKFDKNKIHFVILSGLVTIFVIISTLYKLYINSWLIDYKFLLNIIIIVGSLILTLILIKEYLDNKDITDKYLLLDEYLKTSAEIIEKYSTTIHKYKNNLIAIKGYLKSNPEEANRYIDTLLDSYKSKKYNWFSKINYIKKDGVRYLIYYKLSKAEESKLLISVDVSRDIKKITDDNLTNHETNVLLDILGEYFDNAIYACSESKEKELSLTIYNEKDKIYIILANTYKEKFDISLITKFGYTTKGKGHGLGLYDVDKSLKNLTCFEAEYDIKDKYFTVTLCIDNKVKEKHIAKRKEEKLKNTIELDKKAKKGKKKIKKK